MSGSTGSTLGTGSGGLPSYFDLSGVTLVYSSVTSNKYVLNFSVSGVTFNNSYLDTTNGDFYNIGNPSDSNPPGFLNGILKLVDLSTYVPGTTLIDFVYDKGITINTDASGNASTTFEVPIKSSYQFQLIYNNYYATVINYQSFYGPPYFQDFAYPYNINFIPFTPPVYGPDGLFSVDTVNVTPAGSSYASVSLVGARYNGELLGTTGSIKFFQNQGITGTTGGLVSSASGITLNTISSFLGGAKTATLLYPPGPTFDTGLGDYYMVYYLTDSSTSSNYVSLPQIDLPVDATTSYDTTDVSGVTLVTLTNLSYNFRTLNPGDTVGISIAGSPAGTQPTIRSVSPARSVTFAAINARRSSGVFFSSPVSGLSRLSYATPVYTSVPEYLGATLNSRVNITTNPNDGFRVNFSFNYTDVDGVSIFSRGHTGNIQVTGLDAAAGYSKSIPCSGAGNYSFNVDNSLTSAPGNARFTIAFYDSVSGLRSSTNELTTYWNGLVTTNERMSGSTRAIIQSGNTFTYSLSTFNYNDAYNYSIFDPNYVRRSPTSGVTSTPFVFNTQGVVQGGTYVNITSPGFYSFGISAAHPFHPGTTIIGANGANSFAGTVFASTLSSVVINCTTFSSPAVSNQWGITGSYAEYYGTTGTISIVQSPGVVLKSFPFQYGVSTYSGVANRGPSGSTGGITYGIYFFDESLRSTRSSFLPLIIQNMSTVGPSGNTGYGPTGNPGPTYVNGASGATLEFGYIYNATAGSTAEYTVLGEVNAVITPSYTITMNVPVSDMNRMLIYQSAWDILDPATGATLQGFLGGQGYGQTGVTLVDPLTGAQVTTAGSTAYYGPNVALLLGSVLNNIQKSTGGTYSSQDRITNLDNILSNTGATFGSALFIDDAGNSIPPVGYVFARADLKGASGSILTNLPSEAIATITNTGLTLTRLDTLLVDIDTLTGSTAAYVPALHNIFAQSVAYSKVDDTIPISVSNFGFSYSGQGGATANPSGDIATEWNNGLNVYGVSFAAGDTVTLYVKYEMSSNRAFQVDQNVTNGLDPTIFTVGQVLSIRINGTNVTLPLGPSAWYTEKGIAKYVTYGLSLRATPSTTSSVFDL